MLDWLIVGGGVHGTHLSLSLLRRNRVSPSKLRVLDPHPEPLQAWRQRCAVTGMTHLRSPGVHHLGLAASSLRRFAGRKRPRGSFQSPYDLPSLELFSRHCEHLIHEHRLRELRLRGTATALEFGSGGLRVDTADGVLEARRVVLGLGPAGLRFPAWAEEAASAGAAVEHAFAPGFCPDSLPSEGDLLVVGGGQSAVQLAVHLAATRPGRVTLLTRHDWRVAHFDAEPTWVGGGLRRLQALRCYRERRSLLVRARLNGSVTPREYRRFRRAEGRGDVRRQVGTVEAWRSAPDGIRLTLAGASEELRCDQVVLATGFSQAPPGAAWLSSAVNGAELPRAPCGYPRVDRLLQWSPRLHVAGALAELELGPAARNIVGGRMAAERLASLA